jgi:hypothetical protein
VLASLGVKKKYALFLKKVSNMLPLKSHVGYGEVKIEEDEN